MLKTIHIWGLTVWTHMARHGWYAALNHYDKCEDIFITLTHMYTYMGLLYVPICHSDRYILMDSSIGFTVGQIYMLCIYDTSVDYMRLSYKMCFAGWQAAMPSFKTIRTFLVIPPMHSDFAITKLVSKSGSRITQFDQPDVVGGTSNSSNRNTFVGLWWGNDMWYLICK